MYNGIGLTTPRGSGTNGYVQRNLSYVRPKQKVDLKQLEQDKQTTSANKKPNAQILEHNAKRKIEVQLMMYREKLQEKKYSESEIEELVGEMRTKLTKKLERGEDIGGNKLSDSHAVSAAKQLENDKLRKAFGLSESTQEGAAFARILRPEDKAKLTPEQKALIEASKQTNADGKAKEPRAPGTWLDPLQNYKPREREEGGGRRKRRSSRSRSRSRSRSGSSSRSRNNKRRSRSPKRRSRSPKRGKGRGRSRSNSRDRKSKRERSRSRETRKQRRSPSNSPSRKDKKNDKPARKEKSKSKSPSPAKKTSRSKSASPARKNKSKSKSKSPSPVRKNKSKSKSKSPVRRDKSKSRSKSKSPNKKGGSDSD